MGRVQSGSAPEIPGATEGMRKVMSDVELQIADGVALLTLNQPERLNALSDAMNDSLVAAFVEAIGSAEVRAIVLTGAGRAFCAGADTRRLDALIASKGADYSIPRPGSPVPALAGIDAPAETLVCYTLPFACPKPVIAAVNGACAGAGLVMAASADVRFASDSAIFTAAFAQRGLVAEYGMSWVLPRLVGMGVASDMMLSGRRVDAAEALRIGLANRVVPAEQLLEAAMDYARTIATTASPRSTAIVKRQLQTDMEGTFAAATTRAWDLLREALASDDFAEGVASFREKRPPAFTGR
jgi:enoyl-CoA hydratase/carnithine racemase